MTLQEIIDGLKFTIDMFLLDPNTGETITEPRNDMDKTTVDACKGAIELLKQTRWIPLDEKEPKDGQLVFVTFVNKYKKRYVQIAEFIEENYRKRDGEIDQRYYGFHSVGNIYEWADEAVAWCELPEPYQPEIPTGAEGSDKE